MIKREFISKFFTYFFLYGYICLFFGITLSLLSVYLFYKLRHPFHFVSVIIILITLPIWGQFLRIVGSTKDKYRYYKLSKYRLESRTYKDEYFECEMHELCFRLIIRDILFSYGYKKEYFCLVEKCRGKNLKIERAKEKLLEKVKIKNQLEKV